MSEKISTPDNRSLDNISIIIQNLNKNDNANKTSAGFIYQDLVLMKQLLYLEDDGTQIGYEVLDDIHKQKKGNLELIQVKSSINDDPLTESSIDFWKTLFNWAKIVKVEIKNNIKFVFYTNRELSKQSDIFNELIKTSQNITSIIKFINILYLKLEKKEKEKSKGQSANPIFEKVKMINSLNTKQKEYLFQNFEFVISTVNIIKEIKQKIKFFAVDKEKDINSTYERLLGIITNKRFELAKNDKDFMIDYNYFRTTLKFDKLLKLARVEEINFDEYYNYRDKNKYNEDYKNKTFYKQMIDINIPTEEINNFARERANSSSFLDELELLESEENIINAKLMYEWEDIHNQEYKKAINDEQNHKLKARNCLNETSRLSIYHDGSNLPKPLTKGKFIDLSDKPRLGWRLDWKEKYSE